MKTVTDAIPDISLNTSMDFKDYTKGNGVEYIYNRNGAMTKDLNKGISAITYNSLNLPQTVDIKNKTVEGRNEYTYSASGAKLRAVQRWNPGYSTTPVIGSAIDVNALSQTETMDYAGNIIYENQGLKRILVDGGYNEAGNYYFYIRDHLGNNRVVINQYGDIVQSTQYYPFGNSFAEGTGQSDQPYKYNDKELDTRNGLNMYDYSARWKYDWNFSTVDPLAEKKPWLSPYIYARNNPLRFIDPDGRDEWEINEKGEYVKQIENTKMTGFYIVNSNGERIKGRSLEFEYTKIIHTKGTIDGLVNADGTPIKYETFSMLGDENGTKVFEFLAQQFGTTKEYGGIGKNRDETIEWSINKFGNEGENAINHISTSFQTSFEARSIEIIENNAGIPLKESTHNHPYSGPNDLPIEPSGNSGDTGAVKKILNNYTPLGVTPIFKIYSGAQKKYVKYNDNGIIK